MIYYDLIVLLINTGNFNWALKTERNVVLLEFKESSRLEAETKARQFLSSWPSVNLIVKNEEDK